jgi:ABC-type nitrate/sulfonate/bicarbonate transport system substrate-binding protein
LQFIRTGDFGGAARIDLGPEEDAEVALAREAVDVWRAWHPGETRSLDEKLAAIIYYAENDAWLPIA